MKTLTLWCTSDTHSQHNFLKPHYPEEDTIDVLIHAGDYSYRGTQEETHKFCEWLKKMQQKFLQIANFIYSRNGVKPPRLHL